MSSFLANDAGPKKGDNSVNIYIYIYIRVTYPCLKYLTIFSTLLKINSTISVTTKLSSEMLSIWARQKNFVVR